MPKKEGSMWKKFRVSVTVYAILKLKDAVINVVDDEWRASIYDLQTPEEIAGHIGRNLILNTDKLSKLDGWADQPDSNAELEIYDEEVDAEEL